MQLLKRIFFILCVFLTLTLLWCGISFAFNRNTIDDIQNTVQKIIRQKKQGNSDATKRLQRIAEILSKFDIKDYSRYEILNKLGKFIVEDAIPSYIFNGKEQYKYVKGNNIFYLSGTNIRFRSAPSKRANIITTLNKESTEYMTYLGEWTNPNNKEHWILAINTVDGSMDGKLGWIYGEYVRLVPNSKFRSIIREINSTLSPPQKPAINTVKTTIPQRATPRPAPIEVTPVEENSNNIGFFFHFVMDYGTLNFNEVAQYITTSWGFRAFGVICALIGIAYGGIIGVILGIIAAAIISWAFTVVIVFVWNYIIPFILNSAGHIAIAVIIYGASIAIRNYFRSFVRNRDPYKYYVDKTKGAQKNVLRKSYFFGPGYASVIKTAKEAAKDNINVLKNIRTWIDEHSDTKLEYYSLGIVGWLYLIFSAISIISVGCSVTLLCSAVHLLFMFVVMAIVYILFSAIWIADRIALYHYRINSDCHKCHERYLVPAFVCPNCKRMHTKLIPSAYGILHHICKCGKELPCTFFNGRNQLQAVCPRCSDEEHKIFIRLHSNVHPISIQLVGASGAGKSVYLASAIIKFMETLSVRSDIKASETDKIKSDRLRRIYSTGHSSHTDAKNAVMYPVQISSPRLETDRLLSFYDIGGEFFVNAERGGTVAMVHLNYADGLLFLIDACKLKNSNNNTLEQDEIIVNSLVNYMDGIGTKRNGGKFAIPFMVLFSKYTPTERDEKYKSLIISRSNNLITTIESNFSEVHYYATSAAGGEMRHSHELNPWPNILTPIHDIIKLNDKELAAIILP